MPFSSLAPFPQTPPLGICYDLTAPPLFYLTRMTMHYLENPVASLTLELREEVTENFSNRFCKDIVLALCKCCILIACASSPIGHFFARPFFKNASQRKAVEVAPRQQMLK